MAAVMPRVIIITGPSGAGKTSLKMQLGDNVSTVEENARGITKAMRAQWVAAEEDLVVVTKSAVENATAFAEEHGILPDVVYVQNPNEDSDDDFELVKDAAAKGYFGSFLVVRRAAPRSSTDRASHAWTIVHTDPTDVRMVKFLATSGVRIACGVAAL